jgi:outer membrane lipoprotein-sorting protein
MKKIIVLLCTYMSVVGSHAQVTDPEAGAILEKAAAKYNSLNGLQADFTLTTINPKLKPEDDESKNTSSLSGQLYMKGKAFKIVINSNEIYCDGKTIWIYSPKTKEVQINDYQEDQETFSPTKIFSIYKEGYSYQIKEKKTYQGKNITVIELAPINHKVSFFKIDVGIEDGTNNLMESKVYEKSGVRYIYKINSLNTGTALSNDFFVFDIKKYQGIKVVDLR